MGPRMKSRYARLTQGLDAVRLRTPGTKPPNTPRISASHAGSTNSGVSGCSHCSWSTGRGIAPTTIRHTDDLGTGEDSSFLFRRALRQRFAGAGLGWRSRTFSISSMVAFISAIAASNGADVVMSTPASFNRSIAYFELPDDSIFRYASRRAVLPVFS